MEFQVTVTVPKLIYDIYMAAAQEIKACTIEQVMSGALQAYAQYLYEDMCAKGELEAVPE